MRIEGVKMNISKKMLLFLMSQGSLNQKIGFLGHKLCFVAREHTDTQTHTKVNAEDILSGFQDFFHQPIMKDRSNGRGIAHSKDCFTFTTHHLLI